MTRRRHAPPQETTVCTAEFLVMFSQRWSCTRRCSWTRRWARSSTSRPRPSRSFIKFRYIQIDHFSRSMPRAGIQGGVLKSARRGESWYVHDIAHRDRDPVHRRRRKGGPYFNGRTTEPAQDALEYSPPVPALVCLRWAGSRYTMSCTWRDSPRRALFKTPPLIPVRGMDREK